MKHTAVALALALAALATWALPTVDAVQAEVRKGNYTSAESMMREVVAAKPDSARAHYVYAEILAHNQQIPQASAELQQAQRLDPQLRFTQPDKLKTFQRELALASKASAGQTAAGSLSAPIPVQPARQTTSAQMQAPADAASGGVPGWVWGLGSAGIAFVLWRTMSSRRSTEPAKWTPPASVAPAAATTFPSPGYAGGGGYANGGYGMTPQPTAGSGLAKAGLAAAGGFAAGMLADRLLNGDHNERGSDARSMDTGNNSNSSAVAANSSGMIPGMFDDATPAMQDLAQRPVDFGSGNNDWSDGGSDSAESNDNGGW